MIYAISACECYPIPAWICSCKFCWALTILRENAFIGWRPTFRVFLTDPVKHKSSGEVLLRLWNFQTYAPWARYEGLALVLVHGRPCSPHPELWKTSQSCGSTFGHAPSLEVHRCCREARYYVQQTCKMIHMFSLSKGPCLDSVDVIFKPQYNMTGHSDPLKSF